MSAPDGLAERVRDLAREPRGRPLPAAELERLRAMVACVGCGAIRRDCPPERGATTEIRHGPGCPTRLNREDEPRGRTVVGRARGPGRRRGPRAEQHSSPVGNADVTVHDDPAAGRAAEGVRPVRDHRLPAEFAP